jgi:hypothetical protein
MHAMHRENTATLKVNMRPVEVCCVCVCVCVWACVYVCVCVIYRVNIV